MWVLLLQTQHLYIIFYIFFQQQSDISIGYISKLAGVVFVNGVVFCIRVYLSHTCMFSVGAILMDFFLLLRYHLQISTSKFPDS